MENTRISHYQVGRLLGRGGMGEVYEGVDLDLDRKVALKFIAPELSADSETVRRFEREARAAARLSHPHIATVYAFEREGSRPFIAMELMAGESLRDRLRHGALPIDQALSFARDVASALALAHRRGIVHRDIKPENLMFEEDGAIKVTDFGLAHAVLASRITTTGSTLGTAAYMAPESVRASAAAAGAKDDAAIGAPADMFALGVVLHEMLTGELPFTGESPLALLYTIANEEPRSARAARPDVSVAVEDLVRRVLTKDPAQRPDAGTVARELAKLTGAPAPIFEGETEELEVSRVPRTTNQMIAPAPRPRRRRRRWEIFAASLILAVAMGFWILALGPGSSRSRREAVLLNNLGIEALESHHLDRAREHFEAALRKHPRFGQAMLNLGQVYVGLGQAQRAESLYSAVLELRPIDSSLAAAAHYNLAELDMRAGTWESAIQNLERSFALDSTQARVYNNLGYALTLAGRPADGLALLKRGLARFEGEPLLYKNAGLAAIRLGDFGEAIANLSRAIELQRDLAIAHKLRALAYWRQGQEREARADENAYNLMAANPSQRDLLERDLPDLRAIGVLPSEHLSAGNSANSAPSHPTIPSAGSPSLLSSVIVHSTIDSVDMRLTGGSQLYDVLVWLEMAEDLKRLVRQVTYAPQDPEHESIPMTAHRGLDFRAGFRVPTTASWTIRLELRNGRTLGGAFRIFTKSETQSGRASAPRARQVHVSSASVTD